MAKHKLKKDYLVVKQNALNEMRSKEMTVQELRLFSVYLSKINPKDPKTKVVRFPLNDFLAIMELKEPNILYFKGVAEKLLRKPIFVPTERGGFDAFNLFSRFRLDADEDGEWYVDINATDEALPLLFGFQGRFFKYKLWNTLRLKGKNQYRMYEVLKQNERIGNKIISVPDLKSMLGIDENEYPEFKHFKQSVLEPCRKALSELTDISYTYEIHSKKGRKIYELKFTIIKNMDYVDQLSLDNFINMDGENTIHGEHQRIDISVLDNGLNEIGEQSQSETSPIYEERINFLREACDNEFSREEMVVIYSIMQQRVPYIHASEMKSHDFLRHKYREFLLSSKKTEIKNRYSYFKRMVEVGDTLHENH